MKEIFDDFLKLFANSVVMICLMIASFVLFINLYHYRELTRDLNINLSESIKYMNFKSNVDAIEKKIDGVRISSIEGTRNTYASIVQKEIKKCVDELKNSQLYKLQEKDVVVQRDIQNINFEMSTNLNNVCMFYMNYNINDFIAKYDSKNRSFDSVDARANSDKVFILSSTDYILKRLENNSSYSYQTEVTRNSIFNEPLANFSLSLDNYNSLLIMVENTTNWFVNEFGGRS